MPAYVVRYTNPKGRVRKETMFAPDIAYLQGMLQRKKCWPLSIKMEERKSRTYRTKLATSDLISILDQIEIQLEVNINIDDAFRNLVDEFPRGKPKFVIAHISDEINSSGRVAEACAQFPRVFPEHTRQMIAVGESTGKLANSFRRLIEYFQSADALKATISSACMYPALVIVMMIMFVVIIFGLVVPKLVMVYKELGVKLPLMTRVILATSDLITNHPIIVLTVSILIPALIMACFKAKFLRKYVDIGMAKAPIIGPITKDVCISRFASNLGALYESEIPIVQGLLICSKIAGNHLYNRGLELVREAVEQGRSISDGLKEVKIFPTMVVLTIRIGEENGKLDDSLRKLANYHSRKAKERVERALKLFEPTMLIFLVVMVGIMAYALLMPMMQMVEEMSSANR
ncbi:MAG: type II secretion system F family protein [Puniceicoccales bacterium]|jgi:type II secretory pathway component PulF|nr:type II secretion system F family protein [Puniceicoccales bacterium]